MEMAQEEETRRVMNECTFCFSCNHYCPGGLKPYHLIMERFGDYQAFSEIAEKAFNRLSLLNTDRLVCYCDSCANYFGNVWPDCHGLKLPFKIISLYEWLWEQYQEGSLQIQKKIKQDIVISDS